MKVGFLGAGHISGKLADTISAMDGIENYAVASRNLDKAIGFAREHGVAKAYGSYEELVLDPDVELVYVATPNSFHYEHSRMALEAGKPVLCEKAFCVNAAQAEALVELSERRKVFLAEAMLTRHLPVFGKIRELVDEGAIGRPDILSASLCYPLTHKERVVSPDLGGGVLLDIGIYCLNFAAMCFGQDPVRISGECTKGGDGVDMRETIYLEYEDGRAATMFSSGFSRCPRRGVICGSDGWIEVDSINIPRTITLYKDYRPAGSWTFDFATGYEAEILACRDAIAAGRIESAGMTHADTLCMMRQMDALRRSWGVVFPEDLQ